MPYLVEAVRLFDSGASAHDIDEAMLDFGMPMGPLRLLDEVGIDVAAHVVTTLGRHFPELVTAPALIDKMLGARMLGRKTGRGFYEATHDKPNHELEVMRTSHRHTHFTRDELAERMALLMMNEAARCMEEGVSQSPADIDLAMVLGTGFAPFRGGPLRYTDKVGAANVVADLERLAAADPRFTPCALLKAMAARQRSFYVANPPGSETAGPPPAAGDRPASTRKGAEL
jgi:3-hydroxyacyl-CoA dehydrogenase/enoyl-CoA hydratase/3-hydroxybutyryl-CoA epimerase